ncbi:hypothetical protein OPV22_033570 [Ensete ventricosum]|uniref:Uncharacterized protein n=1 Tax=Ensete ventricosum TaxID=4639 RepID=A0AAV8PMY4_ENSVE|nr:hypothetical protein OPV22_033570 [Ensete ventricosum]
MEELDGSFRLYRRDPPLGRSRTCRVLLESSVSSECAQMAKYERLSQSLGPPGEPPRQPRRVGVWRLLTDSFTRKVSEPPRRATAEDTKKAAIVVWSAEGKRRWSSWLPDPDRRWPVQGW